VFWATTQDLVIALCTGSVTDILIGIYYVGPLIIGLACSVLGLVLETCRSAVVVLPGAVVCCVILLDPAGA